MQCVYLYSFKKLAAVNLTDSEGVCNRHIYTLQKPISNSNKLKHFTIQLETVYLLIFG